jgi:hypothetical protein
MFHSYDIFAQTAMLVSRLAFKQKEHFSKKTVCASVAIELSLQIVESGTLPFGKATYDCG